MKVRLSHAAAAFLRAETSYLKRHSPAAAKAFARQMRSARGRIEEFDRIGFESEELPVPGMRRIIVGQYLVDYEIRDREIRIVAVRSGRQLPPSLERDYDYDYEDRRS